MGAKPRHHYTTLTCHQLSIWCRRECTSPPTHLLDLGWSVCSPTCCSRLRAKGQLILRLKVLQINYCAKLQHPCLQHLTQTKLILALNIAHTFFAPSSLFQSTWLSRGTLLSPPPLPSPPPLFLLSLQACGIRSCVRPHTFTFKSSLPAYSGLR